MKEICFAGSDEEVREIAEEALELALTRATNFPVAIRRGAEEAHIKLEKIKKKNRIKALKDALAELIADNYRRAK